MIKITEKNIDTNNNNGYTDRLPILRKKENLTQEQFAEKIKVSTVLVSDIERQKKKLTLSNAIEIAKQFNVSLDWLYDLTDDTKDSASNILSTLKDIFDIDLEKKCIKVDKNLAVYLEGLSEVYKAKASKKHNLPEEAFNYWLNGIKTTYNENPKSGEKTLYYLQSQEEYLGELEEERIKKQIDY